MRWNPKMQQYMHEHVSLYSFVIVLFMTGVIFGAVMVNALSLEQKQELTRYLGHFFNLIDGGGGLSSQVTFQQVFGMHMKWILLIWLLGLSVIGLPLILILDFLKGVLIGFSVGYLVGQFSWKGMLFALVSIAPQNLVIIPAIVICSVTAIAFSIHLVKNRFFQRRGPVYHPFIKYSILTFCAAFLLFCVSAFEAYLSPVLMKWVTPLLVAMY